MHFIISLLMTLTGLFYHMPSAASEPLFSPEERRWIAEHQQVIYNVIPSWPLDYEEKGQHFGLSRDYLDVISKISGLNFILTDGAKAPQLISAISPEFLPESELKEWRFSQRWMTTHALVISDNDAATIQSLQQLSGKRVAVRRGTYYESWLREHHPEISLVPQDHTRGLFEAIYSGDADVGLGADLVIRPLYYRYYSHKLAIAGQIPELRAGINIAIRQDQPLLLSIINKSLGSIPAQMSNTIFNRWVSDMKLGYPSTGVIFSLYSLEISAFLLLLILLGWMLQRTVKLWRKAMASEKHKTQFLAMMSHEIRTPMNAMIASLELLNRPVTDEQREQYLALASSSARSLLDLLNDILDHSKISQKGIRLESRPFVLAELIRAVCDSYRPLAAQKGLMLSVCITPDLDNQMMEGDPHRIRQVVNNLLSNAIKFTASGSVSVTLKGEFLANKTCMISLDVADTGIGISPEIQHNLFKAWMQADDAPDRHYGGSGLGLWICWQLMRLMKGELMCQSEPDKGSLFSIKLPLRLTEPERMPAEPDLPLFKSDTILLVVEDHPAAQRILKDQLAVLGCQADIVETGAQALSKIADENYYDVILLDINLPDLSGYEVARRLREIEQQRGSEAMPLIAISAMSDETHLSSCQQSGINVVLSKPIVLSSLAHNLRRWCHLSPSTARLKRQQNPQQEEELARWLREDLQGFSAASSDGNVRLMQYHVHRLRGAAQTYNLNNLAYVATRIEAALREGAELSSSQKESWLQTLKNEVSSLTHL
ncbi:response regulator [Enterobacter kobei]|uniref:histidine kinase n=1 Tax=Enterobacter kobei TaxID=208224 RepID=A0AAW3XNA5_9ENTR|nr:ATP-binding protein [Enterobacter kobei]KJM88743.1 hypothetical protein SS33_15455 [Enterobacter kobei]MBC6325435.1 response regulator [Enterobacter kobei]MCU2428649.1 ATP-binding protein [Enterobacter kobei]HCB1630103.1 response regulator [Enterobacter kobei]HCC8327390.1 response regulator [Enterobacter kobei]